jgi:hypothetical protein
MVAFWISSPTFFGDYNIEKIVMSLIQGKYHRKDKLTKPRGPNLGARAEAEPISPPTAFMMTIKTQNHGLVTYP